MPNNLIDIQNSNDDRKIYINKVGVKDIKYPIVVEDRQNKIQHSIANIDIYVDLPHHHRGTHMSRFIEVLNQFHQETLIDKLPDFLKRIKEKLNSEHAYTTIKFPYFIKKTAPISGIQSLLEYNCVFEASYKENYSLTIGVDVPITTLCPCSKEISKYGAHNQRSSVKLDVFAEQFIWLEELIEIIESSASCEIFALLKRPDEKYVTEKAYENPKFVEDMVRDISLKLIADERILAFKLQSENFESIHSHNAYACVHWERK